MSGFSEFWKKASLPYQLDGLSQEQIDAIRHIALQAYRAGRRIERTEKRL